MGCIHLTKTWHTGFLQMDCWGDVESCCSGGNFIKDYFFAIYSEFCVSPVKILAIYVIYVKKVL